jgi:hypothetical protein
MDVDHRSSGGRLSILRKGRWAEVARQESARTGIALFTKTGVDAGNGETGRKMKNFSAANKT